MSQPIDNLIEFLSATYVRLMAFGFLPTSGMVASMHFFHPDHPFIQILKMVGLILSIIAASLSIYGMVRRHMKEK